MRYIRLGKTNIKVWVIGIGTYQFGYRWGKTFTRKEAADIIAAARDNGVNLLDTAECYGMNHLSEKLLGHAIASSRSHWIIATKFGHDRISPIQNKEHGRPPKCESSWKHRCARLEQITSIYISSIPDPMRCLTMTNCGRCWTSNGRRANSGTSGFRSPGRAGNGESIKRATRCA